MKYLLDTNILIYIIEKNIAKLSLDQKEILDDVENVFLISAASLFEIAIKVRLEKLIFSSIKIEQIEAVIRKNGIQILKSIPAHYINIPKVPKVYISETKLHGDPFDLLIISQAIVENLPVLSSDRLFPHYQGLTTIS